MVVGSGLLNSEGAVWSCVPVRGECEPNPTSVVGSHCGRLCAEGAGSVVGSHCRLLCAEGAGSVVGSHCGLLHAKGVGSVVGSHCRLLPVCAEGAARFFVPLLVGV